jgi:hypothetical protein
MPLADRRDEQVRRGHLVSTLNEKCAEATRFRVGFSVETQEDEGIQEVLGLFEAAAPCRWAPMSGSAATR